MRRADTSSSTTARGRPAAVSASASTPSFPVIHDEDGARRCGRLFAKKIFHGRQWTAIGRHRSTDIALAEHHTPAAQAVRLQRTVHGSIQDVEELLSATYRTQLYAKLAPELFSTSGAVINYGPVQHSSKEREYANLQFATLRSGPARKNVLSTRSPDAAARYLFLEYTLATQLQRTDTIETPQGQTRTESRAVASLLYVLQPVHVPFFSERHAEFEPARLAAADFGVTVVVQETEQNNTLSLEIVLSRSADPAANEELRESMLRDVVAFSQMQGLLDGLRHLRSAQSRRGASRDAAERRRHVPETARGRRETRAKSNNSSAPAASACGICHKKFHAFRWRKRCEVCDESVCDQCVSSIANPAAMRGKKRVCNHCLYGNAAFGRNAATDGEASRRRAATQVPPTRLEQGNDRRSKRRSTDPEQRAEDVRPAPETIPIRVAPTQTRAPPPPPPPGSPAVTSSTSWASEEPQGYGSAAERDSEVAPQGYGSAAERDSEVAVRRSSKSRRRTSSSFFDHTEPSGVVSDDEFVTSSSRVRRAQTIELNDVKITPVMSSRKVLSSRGSPVPLRRTFSNGGRSNSRSFGDLSEFTLRLSTQEEEPEEAKQKSDRRSLLMQQPSLSRNMSRSSLQCRQLKTPSISYDLDFDWFNAFPKAPRRRDQLESERVEFMTNQLKLDAHTAMVYLRRDSVLSELTEQIMRDVSMQWDGCSIHLLGEQQVFCLAYSYTEPLLVEDESAALAAVAEDMISRDESASCMIATLDLWSFDPDGASSFVSQDWWQRLELSLACIAARIEEIGRTQASSMAFVKTQDAVFAAKGELHHFHSRRQSAFPSPCDDDEDAPDWTSSPQIPTRRRRHTVGDEQDPQQDFVRGRGAFGRQGRGAAAATAAAGRYSDLETTIESLLHRVTRTSEFVRQQSEAHVF
ncbi:hypothetical protein ATCC90586_002902 [Pythium insidiosum]|nr:hypothetical protein ATCC90586_002902 [Pythium insidiosum]